MKYAPSDPGSSSAHHDGHQSDVKHSGAQKEEIYFVRKKLEFPINKQVLVTLDYDGGVLKAGLRGDDYIYMVSSYASRPSQMVKQSTK